MWRSALVKALSVQVNWVDRHWVLGEESRDLSGQSLQLGRLALRDVVAGAMASVEALRLVETELVGGGHRHLVVDRQVHLNQTICVFFDTISLTSILFDNEFESDHFLRVLSLQKETMEVHRADSFNDTT